MSCFPFGEVKLLILALPLKALKNLRFIPFLLSLLIPVACISQDGPNERKFFIKITGDTLQLDSLSIVPGSFRINDMSGIPLDSAQYYLEPLYGRIIFLKPFPNDSFRVSYRVFNINLSKTWSHKDPGDVSEDKKTITDPFAYNPNRDKKNTDPFGMGGMNKQGSISRGITFGNNQDVVVNSTMNLQLAGKLSDNVELLMSATDDNIPIQPEGNTQQLQEFDKIFIQLSSGGNKLVAGDFELKKPESYFMNYYKKTLGLHIESQTVYKDAGKHSLPAWSLLKSKITGSAAVSKGKFARNSFTGIEGNQGPYRLHGAENETFILVLSGSEQVFIDGELLKRGAENDYIIDYNTAEVRFTPNRPITKDKRISVEFQYSDKLFARSLFQAGADIDMNKFKLHFNAYSEQDAKNKPLQQELSDADKLLLASIGDSLYLGFVPSVDSIEFNTTEALYLKKDTTAGTFSYNDIFVYSTDPLLAHFRVGFTFVGQGNGNYIPVNSSANGKVYQWMMPDSVTGELKGSYEPKVQLITPKQKQMVTAGLEYEWNRLSKLTVEGALTQNDINLYSHFNKRNDLGYAGKFDLRTSLFTWKTKSSDGKERIKGIGVGAQYEFVQQTFSPIERFRSVEFERDWNRTSTLFSADQHIAGASVYFIDQSPLEKSITPPLLYRFNTFLEGTNFKAYRHELTLNLKGKKNLISGKGSYLTSDNVLQTTSFLRGNLAVSQDIGFLRVGALGGYENNQWRLPGNDSLLQVSAGFREAEGFIQQADTSKILFRLGYKRRNDQAPKGNILTDATTADNYSAKLAFGNNSQKFSLITTYRLLEVSDTTITGARKDESLLGGTEYQFRLWKGVISSSTHFEIGSGLEQKKEFVFIEVAPGQGVYTWVDYNENSIKELNEFEIAPYPDQAVYIKVFTPTNEYIKTYTNQFSENLVLKPSVIWNNKKGVKKALSFFALQLNFRTDRKSTDRKLENAYNPFLQDADETTLQSLNTYSRNTLFINQGGFIWSAELSYFDSRNKQLLANGFDTRLNAYKELSARWNLNRSWTLLTATKDGDKMLESEFFSSKNFRIHYSEINPRISYQPSTSLRVTASYKYAQKKNLPDLGGEFMKNQTYGIELRYNALQKGTFMMKIDYIMISYPHAGNTSLAFEMLEGLKDGENMTWAASFQRNISGNLQLSLTYDGRKSEGTKPVHTGGASVRAFF